jgi:hypothetical protein
MVQLQEKISSSNPQGPWLQDKLIGGKSPFRKLNLILSAPTLSLRHNQQNVTSQNFQAPDANSSPVSEWHGHSSSNDISADHHRAQLGLVRRGQ